MAFFLDDDDTRQAFEAALSFVDEYPFDGHATAGASPPRVAAARVVRSPRPGRTDGGGGGLNGMPSFDSATCIEDGASSSGNPLEQQGTQSACTENQLTTPLRPASTEAMMRRRVEINTRKKLLRKAGLYGDPNRARKERHLEMVYLREQLEKLQLELQSLKAQPSQKSNRFPSLSGEHEQTRVEQCAADSLQVVPLGAASQMSSVWQGVADRQRLRREKAERENVHLRLTFERQRKTAEGLETLLRKRARQQMAECSSFSNPRFAKFPLGRVIEYRGDIGAFQGLFRHLEAAYREVDAVFAANGLAAMENTQQDVHIREGVNNKYLEVFANKALPFELGATTEAAWDHFKGVEKHRGNGDLYEKEAKDLDVPYTIVEHFTKEMISNGARADIRVQQVVRRHVEADRDIVIWVSSAAPIEISNKLLAGLTFHRRGYALIKRAAASTAEHEMSLLQLCSLMSLDQEAEAVYNPAYVRALTNFLAGNAAGNIRAHQEWIENGLLDQMLRSRVSEIAKAMAFLEEEDAMRAFEAALSFVEEYAIDTSAFTESPALFAASAKADWQPSPSEHDEDMELLSRGLALSSSLTGDSTASSVAGSDGSTPPSPSPPSQAVSSASGSGERRLQTPRAVSARRKSLENGKRKKTGPKKPVTRGDPNRARNERKIELVYLREKVAQLELELHAMRLHPRAKSYVAIRQDEASGEAAASGQDAADSTIALPDVWQEVASRQRRRREKAERENVRLKLIAENQLKMAKSLESLLQKRAKQQVVECSSLSKPKTSKYSQGRTLDFRADVNDFTELLAHLDKAYHEVDAVFAANALSTMETTHRDARMREGADCMYLDIFANKIMPFGMRATAQAVWNHFKGAEKHRGNMYEKVAKHLETPDTIIEDFAKEFFADSARADFRVKQVLRRHVEADREIVVWVASVVPLEFDDHRVKGLGFRHQGYALTKRAAASTSAREFSLLQLCSLVSPEKKHHTVYDPVAVRALTDFMLGTVAGNITASQELIENVLMDQVVTPHQR